MKKNLPLLFLMFAFAASGQTSANRFFYELTYKPSKDSIKTEKTMMILDINKEKSIYQSYQTVAQDSIFKVAIDEMTKTGNFSDMKSLLNIKPDAFPERVIKTYPIKEIEYSNKIFMDTYNYKETPTFNWKISNAKEKIGNYDTQKATVEYGGRIWTAWFSPEIPFPDGPYKFSGLPGLIVKIEDSVKNYSWVLNGNKTIPEIADKLYMNEIMKQTGQSKELSLTKEKFEKRFEEYQKDPFASIRQLLSGSGGNVLLSQNFKENEKQIKKKFAQNNNSIEIPAVEAK